MVKLYQENCFEVFSKSLNLLFLNSEEYKRLSIIGLDNSCELAMKSFLVFEKRIKKRDVPENFYDLKEKVLSFFKDKKHIGYVLNKIFEYHEVIRNDLYHEGNKHSINLKKLYEQAKYTYTFFRYLFGQDFNLFLQTEPRLNFIELYIDAKIDKKDLSKIEEEFNLIGLTPLEELDDNSIQEIITAILEYQ